MSLITMSLAIVVPFLAAAFIPFLYKKLSHLHIGWFVLPIPLILFLALARYVPSIARGETFVYSLNWIPSFQMNLTTYLDGLSLIFGLLITGIGFLVTLYSIYYLSTDEALNRFYIYLLLFMGSMLGVVFSDNLFVLYVFWEFTSISSFLLIAFWYQRKGSRYGAKKSLLITVSGGFAMLVGFIMLYSMADTLSIRDMIATVNVYKDHPLFITAMMLVLLGAFTKSAQFPFHIWLPDAMEAPTPVSAYLHSATMVKAGIYLVARYTPVFAGESLWFWTICTVGLITLFWGSFTAIRQTDLKALLAYSTVSQLGLIMSLFGISSIALYQQTNLEYVLFSQAAFVALFHLVNHSTFKGALFMVIGIIDLQVGTRDIRRLGGLMTLMPISFTIALIGSFSMAGLPPFNGFLSKEMFFTAVLSVKELHIFSLETFGSLFPWIAWGASVLTFVYCLIIVFKTFLGKLHDHGDHWENKEAEEAPLGMLLAPITLASLVVIIFFYPNVIGDYLLRPAVAGIFPTLTLNENIIPPITAWHGFNTELIMTIGIIVLGTFIYFFLKYWNYVYRLFPKKWSFDRIYNSIIEGAEKGSTRITTTYMTGFLRDYLVYIFLFFILSLGGYMIYAKVLSFNLVGDTPITTFVWIITLSMMITAIAILFAKSRLTAIILNGFIGFSVALLFVIFRAPDLALTQVVVESVTTALFLLCYYFLPEMKPENDSHRVKLMKAGISLGVGTLFVLIALSVKSGKLFESISSYFERAYELAGGKNIVNTILADFRAFDTMLEVVVLVIAGIGVYSLIKVKKGSEVKNIENQ